MSAVPGDEQGFPKWFGDLILLKASAFNKVIKVINEIETTAAQVEFISKLPKEFFDKHNIFEGHMEDTQLAEYIARVYDMEQRVQNFLTSSAEDPSRTLQEKGIVGIPVDKTIRLSFENAFSDAVKDGSLRWKHNAVNFDPSRNRRQLTTLYPLVDLLQRERILTPHIVKIIQGYVGDSNHMECVSALFINARGNEEEGSAVQMLHWDNYVDNSPDPEHSGQSHGGEVVLALDLGGNPLRTRFYMGSHICKANANNGYKDTITTLSRNLTSVPQLADRKHGTSRTSLARLLVMLIQCFKRKHQLEYIDAPCDMILFDAGGFHSGGATDSRSPRMFLTFRSKKFRQSLQEYLNTTTSLTEDNWFVQRAVKFTPEGRVIKPSEVTSRKRKEEFAENTKNYTKKIQRH